MQGFLYVERLILKIYKKKKNLFGCVKKYIETN